MEKLVKFTDQDKELIAKIQDYQKAHGLPHFITAVRKLCNDALAVEKITH